MISSMFSTSLGLPSSLFYSQLPSGRVGCHKTFLLPASDPTSSYRKAPPLPPPRQTLCGGTERERRAGLERYFFFHIYFTYVLIGV